MEDIKFSSLQELYNRVKPALRSKVKELSIAGYKFIKEEDVFNYLKNSKWSKKNNLTLSELVNDIFTTPNEEFLNSYTNNLEKSSSNLKENNLL